MTSTVTILSRLLGNTIELLLLLSVCPRSDCVATRSQAQMEGSLNYCSQTGGGIYIGPRIIILNIGPRIDSNLGQSPDTREVPSPGLKGSILDAHRKSGGTVLDDIGNGAWFRRLYSRGGDSSMPNEHK